MQTWYIIAKIFYQNNNLSFQMTSAALNLLE